MGESVGQNATYLDREEIEAVSEFPYLELQTESSERVILNMEMMCEKTIRGILKIQQWSQQLASLELRQK